MRAFWYALAAVALTSWAFPAAQSPQRPSPDASSVLAAARDALGGEKRLAAVKTLVSTGRTRQVRGDNLVPIEFEIDCELPDKYVRRDEIPAQESGPTSVGFNGDNLIQLPLQASPVQGRPGGPPPPTPEQLDAARRVRAIGVKQDFARLMLGLFAGSFSSYPLTFAYAGQAEAPQGMADILDVKGPANVAMRLFVHRDTHLPVMVTWQGAGPEPGRGPGLGAPAENRLYLADYRDIDGLRLPFRLRRALGPDTIEETTFDRFRINAKIDPRKFEVSK
jgi:hypothetical protein